MKTRFLITKVLTALAIALSACSSQPTNPPTNSASARSQLPNPTASTASKGSDSSQLLSRSKFTCVRSNGVPTTMARTSRGNIPMIRWVSSYFSNSGYDPQTRCEEVSGRFQTYQENGRLKYVGVAELNGYPILCVAEQMPGSCLNVGNNKGLLFTLKPDSDPNEILRQMLRVRDLASSPLEQAIGRPKLTHLNSQGYLFVDLEQYLKRAPVEDNK
ncbi:MAG: hypothetical protein F6J93_22270 [Oscillatoria sp. SIO1A7]|nr:hypothetical protein [Oscillatoria sp. SIO1A7]